MSRKACLIIHGLSASPGVVKSLVAPLEKSGFEVFAPMLAGHGSTVEVLAASTRHDWYKGVKDAYQDIAKNHDEICVIGISLGSLLAMKLGIESDDRLKGLVLISTPLFIGTWLEKFVIPIARHTPLKYIIKSTRKNWEEAVFDPVGRQEYIDLTLPRMPTNSAIELTTLSRELKPELKKLARPLLLIHSRLDRVCPIQNVDIIQKSVTSKHIETLILERSGHVVTLDYEKTIVADAVANFVRRMMDNLT